MARMYEFAVGGDRKGDLESVESRGSLSFGITMGSGVACCLLARNPNGDFGVFGELVFCGIAGEAEYTEDPLKIDRTFDRTLVCSWPNRAENCDAGENSWSGRGVRENSGRGIVRGDAKGISSFSCGGLMSVIRLIRGCKKS